MASILVVEDQEQYGELLTEFLHALGHSPTSVADAEQAFSLYQQYYFDLVLSDIQMGRMSGLDLLKSIMDYDPNAVVIMMTAYTSPQFAVDSFRLGACDFFSKPIQLIELREAIHKAVRQRQEKLDGQPAAPHAAPATRNRNLNTPFLAGDSELMQQLRQRIAGIVENDLPVLIQGEGGTGKYALSELIHRNRSRSSGPFVTVNLKNHSQGELFSRLIGPDQEGGDWLREARNGTLYLMHIDRLPQDIQALLPEVLESVEEHMSFIATCENDLDQTLSDGGISDKVYFYFSQEQPLRLPALRSRTDDLEETIKHMARFIFESHFGGDDSDLKAMDVEPEALALLLKHSWPNNLTELFGVISSMVCAHGAEGIQAKDLPAHLRGGKTLQLKGDTLQQSVVPEHVVTQSVPWSPLMQDVLGMIQEHAGAIGCDPEMICQRLILALRGIGDTDDVAAPTPASAGPQDTGPATDAAVDVANPEAPPAPLAVPGKPATQPDKPAPGPPTRRKPASRPPGQE